MTAISQKGKEVPPKSRGYDGVETSDENVPPSKPLLSERPNAGMFPSIFFLFMNSLITLTLHCYINLGFDNRVGYFLA